MIESKLGELIHNRRTNIKEVHEATGLSRTTISNLVNGYASGIRFETLTKLSNHFNCEITDIINYEKEEEV
ncbi:hypothetical protein AAT16_09185 [Salinicoccus halodurans]|nr:hypothetical protein AAT16_09185 [Salinicoccus halodurans]